MAYPDGFEHPITVLGTVHATLPHVGVTDWAVRLRWEGDRLERCRGDACETLALSPATREFLFEVLAPPDHD